MIKYYPSTRIKTNLYTRGGELFLPDRKSYSGRYYLTYDGKAFTGPDPVSGTNILLTRVREEEVLPKASLVNTGGTPSQDFTQGATIATSTELGRLVPYYPVPLESDYARGYFTRYFAKQLTGPGYILEISQADWSNLENGLTEQTFLAYEITSMLWQLTGPLNNVRVSQYQIKGGVYDTNKRVTEAKEATFRGIISYIGGEYTKFARITP
jgi:hypothetical protein